ncbi:MAG TPA: SRPBCC family protein [Candidatus Acidoferrum sp.]|nr:SRPBCC family protein [Candidatus Acidoferrum sp.]
MLSESVASFPTDHNSFSAKIPKLALLAGGSALAAYGIARHSKTGIGLAAVGSLMAVEGTRLGSTKHFQARSSFAINCAPGDAYRYWRKFENLPSFMSHLSSVRVIDDRRSEWTVMGPLAAKIQWTAEIADEQQDELIAWRSTPGALFQFSGWVEFRPDTGGRGAVVTASMTYSIPGGALGKTIASIFGKHPEFLLREDLRKFKALMESGEVPTTAGQSHGKRSKLVSAFHAVRSKQQKTVHCPLAESPMTESRAL